MALWDNGAGSWEAGIPKKLIREKVTSFFSFRAIISLHFPTGEKKNEERKEEKK